MNKALFVLLLLLVLALSHPHRGHHGQKPAFVGGYTPLDAAAMNDAEFKSVVDFATQEYQKTNSGTLGPLLSA